MIRPSGGPSLTETWTGGASGPSRDPSPHPVLVGGCPRSGTTLLGAMLGVGQQRLASPESTFKFRLLEDLADETGALDVRAALHRLANDPLFGLWGVAVPDLEGPSVSRDPSLLDGPPGVTYAQLLDGLVRAYGAKVGKPAPSLWIDHTPGNILHAASLARVLPEARFIHLVRDGRAVAASLLPLDWGPNTLAEAARWWATSVAAGLAAERVLGAGRVLLVRFEDLLRNPEATLRTICAFVGSPYEPAMISGRDYTVGSYTEQMHRRVAEPPDPRRGDAWRARLTPSQVATFEWLTRELLDLLGYERVHGPHARPGTRRERVVEAVTDVARRALSDRARRALRRRRIRR